MTTRTIGNMQLSTPGDREIVMSRVFNAPRALVYDAFTKPELLKRWLGVHNGWTMTVCEIDLRPGGTYRYAWEGRQGMKMSMGGEYREIVPATRIARPRSSSRTARPRCRRRCSTHRKKRARRCSRRRWSRASPRASTCWQRS